MRRSTAEQPRSSRGINAAIGIALVLAGAFVLADGALATIVRIAMLAIAAICAGSRRSAFQF